MTVNGEPMTSDLDRVALTVHKFMKWIIVTANGELMSSDLACSPVYSGNG